MIDGRDGRAKLSDAADALVAVGIALVVAVFALLALQRLGQAGMALVLGLGAAAMLLRWPAVTLFGAVAVAILFEDVNFGLLPVTSNVYEEFIRGVAPIDLIFAVAALGVMLKLLRERRPIVLPPPPLSLAVALIGLALASGVVVGRANGTGTAAALLATHMFVYVALVPLLIVNLGLDERQVRRVLVGVGVLAVVKAVLGIAAVVLGFGMELDGSRLSYYEPTGNWLTMVVALVAVAALLQRVRPPVWLLATAPLMIASVVLSYRRSFWIALGVALATVVLLGLAPLARRLIVPIVALLAVAVWMLGSIAVQSDTPFGERLQSLSTAEITSNAQDRYRLDERANVLAELRDHPITGLGLEVAWQATERSLPVEVNPDHRYVHFAALAWWLKLGILGLAAFLATMASALALSWRVWRRAQTPMVRAIGLASLCSVVGLLAIESTASFTGIDIRFTVAFGAQLGLLAVLARQVSRQPHEAAPGGVTGWR